jgi:radical SAM protein with 4Fe4S-binding SPASM domain
VTNGMALTETTCNLLGDASWVRVSVDAAEANTYSLIRNVKSDAFKKVVDNIKMLIKHQRKSIIGVGFVVEKENYTEIFNAAKLFKSIGVNNFRISGAFTNAGYSYFRDFKEYATHLSKKAEELSDNYFTVFNLFNDRLADTFVGEQNYRFCPMKELQVYIGADHNVYTCCTLAYNKKGLIGSIKNQSFTDLWRSDKKRLFYKRHNAKKICKHPCMYRGKNEFINYCINEDAKHTNFI